MPTRSTLDLQKLLKILVFLFFRILTRQQFNSLTHVHNRQASPMLKWLVRQKLRHFESFIARSIAALFHNGNRVNIKCIFISIRERIQISILSIIRVEIFSWVSYMQIFIQTYEILIENRLLSKYLSRGPCALAVCKLQTYLVK